MTERCFACGGQFEQADDHPVHAYMLSTPGCWLAYGLVLEREYSDPALFAAVHRLTVDSFAVQHPGDRDDRRAVQSFWIHGAALWLVLEMGVDHARARKALSDLAAGDLPEPPPHMAPRFTVTHADLLAAPINEHARLAELWARSALEGRSDVHGEFERLAVRALEQ